LKRRLHSFIEALRAAGLQITVAETLDAMRAASISGVERSALREGLATTLVKDEADRPAFDVVFERFFAVPRRPRRKDDRRQPAEEGNGGGAGKPGTLGRAGPETERPPAQPSNRRTTEPRHAITGERQIHQERGHRLARRRTLYNTAFHEMAERQAEECDVLAAELAQRFRAHLRRRQRSAHHGRLDVRRTLRRSISRGGVPIDPAFRRRHKGRPDLVALCDHSYSVATASRFLLALVMPAHEFFRRLRLFAFVDRPVEVSLERGALVPHETLDLYARSDFGRVLVEFWARYEPLLTRNTILLILGDARNNRRPPRADLLGRMRAKVREVVWLNPEPQRRWNLDDSVMRAYHPHCDAVLAASSVRELYNALRRAFRAL
jgi:uncharacterized protein with von Willebrand factor type A (vWA) domain